MEIIRNLRKYINKKFINNNSIIVGEMQQYYKLHGRKKSVTGRFILVSKLMIRYNIFKKDPLSAKQQRQERLTYPESGTNQSFTRHDLCERIRNSECIIFDMWNVLVYSVLDTNGLLSFFETAILYPGISEYCNLSALLNKKQSEYLEEISIDFCLDNQYMHEIWNYARSLNKELYIYNNSCYPDSYIQKVLKTFSYEARIYPKKKIDGLYITESDKGKNNIKYQNVNLLGDPYRPFYHVNTVTSLYDQLVNLRLHSGAEKENIYYEYGFTCGGILVCGFCQYLNRLAEYKNIDKFLFVARDGDIMKKVYDRFYNKYPSSYLFFSRFSSYEIIFEDFPEEYIDKNIKERIDNFDEMNSIKKILQSCDLELIYKYLKEGNLSKEDLLTNDNYAGLKKILLNHKDEIAQHFYETSKAARKYFLQNVEGHSNVCIVDLGWKGKSTVYLKHLLEKKYKWKGTVTGAMIGASMDHVTQEYIRNGIIHTYAFDNEFFRRTGSKNGEYMGQEEILCMEALFSAESETLLRYSLSPEGNVNFIYGKENKNKEITREIQRGILDFAGRFAPLIQKYHLEILPRDAYTPLDHVMRNRKFRRLISQNYLEEKNTMTGF